MTNNAVTVLIVLMTLTSVTMSAAGADKCDGVTITYATDNVITMKEPAVIVMTINNASAQAVNTDLGFDFKDNLKVGITSPSEAVCENANKVDEGQVSMGAKGLIYVGPGKMYRQRIVLNHYCRFDEIGKYTIKVGINAAIKSNAGNEIACDKNATLVISVTPRDENALQSRCDEYLFAMRKLQDTQQIMDAADELSYIDDPVCTGHIKEAIALNKVGGQLPLIRGLKRNNTDLSLETLADAFNTIDKTYQAYTIGLLKMAAPKINDPTVRQKVDAVVRNRQ